MNEKIEIEKWVLVEARRALRSVIKDPNGYYSKVFPDDAANIREAHERIKKLLESPE